MGYLSGRPNSNDPPRFYQDGKSPYLEETEFADERFLLLSGSAERCADCRKAVRTKYLDSGVCPDCRAASTSTPDGDTPTQ